MRACMLSLRHWYVYPRASGLGLGWLHVGQAVPVRCVYPCGHARIIGHRVYVWASVASVYAWPSVVIQIGVCLLVLCVWLVWR